MSFIPGIVASIIQADAPLTSNLTALGNVTIDSGFQDIGYTGVSTVLACKAANPSGNLNAVTGAFTQINSLNTPRSIGHSSVASRVIWTKNDNWTYNVDHSTQTLYSQVLLPSAPAKTLCSRTGFWIFGLASKVVTRYPMTTAFDLSTVGAASGSWDLSEYATNDIVDFEFNADGTRVILMCRESFLGQIWLRELSLTTPFSFATRSLIFETYVANGTGGGITMNSAGTEVYLVIGSLNKIYRFSRS